MGFMVGDGRGRSRPLLHPEICMTLQSQRDTLGPQTMSLGTALPPSGLPALVLVKLGKPKKSGNENWEGGGRVRGSFQGMEQFVLALLLLCTSVPSFSYSSPAPCSTEENKWVLQVAPFNSN